LQTSAVKSVRVDAGLAAFRLASAWVGLRVKGSSMAVQDCDQPEWLVAYAWQVHELTRTREAQAKFGPMVRRWVRGKLAVEKAWRRKYSQKNEYGHLVLPDREDQPKIHGPGPLYLGPLSLAARYTVAALVHDFCITAIRRGKGEGSVLNPWWIELDGPQLAQHRNEFQRARDDLLKAKKERQPQAVIERCGSRCREAREAHQMALEYHATLRTNMPQVTQAQEPLIRDCIEAVRADLGGPAAGQAAGGTAAEEPTPDNRAPDERGRPVLQVERWSDLAIGIGEDGSYLAVTPCPECGEVFPKEKAAELDLSGKRWKSLLDLLAQSEDGRQARKTDLMVSFGYRKSHDRPEGSLRDLTDNKYLMKTLKTARGRLTTGIADLARKLRQQVAGPTDPKGKCALSVASAETVEAGFTVRYLLRGTDEKLRFGKPPG
jgi:hypothetical protein